MFDIALDLHKENTYGVVLDDKSGEIVWEGNFASNIKAAMRYVTTPLTLKPSRKYWITQSPASSPT